MRITPWLPMPRSSAHTSTSATVRALSSTMPARTKMSPTSARRRSGVIAHSSDGEVLRQPVAHQVEDDRVALAHQEVVDARDEVQVRRLSGVLEKIDRLLGRRDRVLRRMHEEERPRRDLADDLVRG